MANHTINSRTRGSRKAVTTALAALILAIVIGGIIVIPSMTHAATTRASHVSKSRSTKPATLTFTGMSMTDSLLVGETQMVTYRSHNYTPKTVSVNLIRKVSSNPDRYELVRVVAAHKPNDGSITWVPAASDVGTGLSLEVACDASANACTSAENTSHPLAVNDSNRFSWTASIFDAIERYMNF